MKGFFALRPSSWHFLKDCSFNKLQSDTAIKVSFQGNMRVDGTSSKCNRWFFKFNGNECSGPMTIEAVVFKCWPSGSPNLLHHRSFEGYCENIPQGRVTVELWVGQCHGSYPLGDAHTGWNSVSRIMIEEVSRAQSWLLSSFSYKEWWTILYYIYILYILFFIPPLL